MFTDGFLSNGGALAKPTEGEGGVDPHKFFKSFSNVTDMIVSLRDGESLKDKRLWPCSLSTEIFKNNLLCR